ncbi:uncharacterized protein LOC114322659 isoform X2 [Camellia sinensis]|uniref:uncharacterized protein LOC114322659 isoform X2 n=2 Tax=Camellia sinensis TaxID=4442 RepID=UPI0010363FB0|nr:uncharacterized protein LOC114322659 isoform X2 [Camellia sinensis]
MVSSSESSSDETTSHEDFYTLTKDSLPQIDVVNGVETLIVDGGCIEAERAVDLEDIYFWLKNNLKDDKQKKISNKARHSSCVASKYDGIKKFKIFDDARCLRTFLELSPCRRNYIIRKFLRMLVTLHDGMEVCYGKTQQRVLICTCEN